MTSYYPSQASGLYPRVRSRPLRDQDSASPSPPADLDLDNQHGQHTSVSLAEPQSSPKPTSGYRHDDSISGSSSNEKSITLLPAHLLHSPINSSIAAGTEPAHNLPRESCSRTVYLGNISLHTSAEEILNNVKHGQIERVRLLPDKNCAFISFLDYNDAARFHYDAIMRKLVINDRKVKIGWGKPSHVPPHITSAVEEAGASRSVRLSSLPKISEDELREDLEKFGGIDIIKIEAEGDSALVHYLSIDSAIKAVSKLRLNPQWQHPCQISYGYDRCTTLPKQPRNSGNQTTNFEALTQLSTAATAVARATGGTHNAGNRNIYMGNIHPDTTTKDICDAVKGGSLQHIRYIPDKHICFVTFIDPIAAASFYALGTLEGLEILGHQIEVGWGKYSGPLPRSIELAVDHGASRSVRISKLRKSWTEEQLHVDFSEYGEIESIELSSENNFASINFTNISNALSAVKDMNWKEIYINVVFSFEKDRCESAPRTVRYKSNEVATTSIPSINDAEESQGPHLDAEHAPNTNPLLSSTIEDRVTSETTPENIQHDAQEHSQSYILRSNGTLFSSLMQYSRNFTRPRLAQGYKRLEWVCDCGNYLYADFAESDHVGIRETIDELDATKIGTKASPRTISSQGAASVSFQRGTDGGYLQHTQMPRPGLDIQRDAEKQSQLFIPSEQEVLNANTNLSNPVFSQPRKRFVELCVNTGEFQRQLGEIDVSDVENDSQLFGRIKERYMEIRGFRVKYFLLKPIDVHYVQFCVEDRHRVGILDKPMAIPSEEEMASEGYGYHPCPLKPPPVPANIFLHHLQFHRPHRRLIWGKRIPQKLNRSILQMQSDDELVVGWGVHIIEGLNKFTALAMALAMLCVSAIVSVTWTVVRDDVQGGFGIGAWLTSVQAIVMMMVLTKWNEL